MNVLHRYYCRVCEWFGLYRSVEPWRHSLKCGCGAPMFYVGTYR